MSEYHENTNTDAVMRQIIATLQTCYDPEIPVNIYDLGLIYDIAYDPQTARARIKMTLTSPACPVAGSLPGQVAGRVKSVPGVEDAEVQLVWDPPWTPEQMSEEAKLELNL